MKPKEVVDMIEKVGGKVNEMTLLPDGHGFATASFPLPKDHWIYDEKNVPPMPFRMWKADPRRKGWEERVRSAARYAVRASTMNGKEMDFDPDAMLQNLIVGMFGYHTPDGLSGEKWGNPDPVPPVFE